MIPMDYKTQTFSNSIRLTINLTINNRIKTNPKELKTEQNVQQSVHPATQKGMSTDTNCKDREAFRKRKKRTFFFKWLVKAVGELINEKYRKVIKET